MSKTVVVGLKDLRWLVKLLLAYSIESRAQGLVRKEQSKEYAESVRLYLAEVRKMVPSAREQQSKHFDELLSSLRSGSDVRLALANFVAREAKSPSGTGAKVRRPR
jgi:hypothetical protein